MKKEQDPQDSVAPPVTPSTSVDREGPFERERGDPIDPPDGGGGTGGANTTHSDT